MAFKGVASPNRVLNAIRERAEILVLSWKVKKFWML
jgi:hypothetical protein